MNKTLLLVSILAVFSLAWILYSFLTRDRMQCIAYQKSISMFEEHVMSQIPNGYSENELQTLFREVLERVGSCEADERKLIVFERNFTRSIHDNFLDSLEIDSLILNIKELDDTTAGIEY